MPEYEVYFSSESSVRVIANSPEEAEEKVLNGGFCPHEFADSAECDGVIELRHKQEAQP